MDHNDARPHGRHFRDRMAETGCSKHRPKICLGMIKGARNYHDARAAAEAARRELLDVAVRKSADPRAALAALNHLADAFGFPPFTGRDIAGVDGHAP
jgi:hypothetical protein